MLVSVIAPPDYCCQVDDGEPPFPRPAGYWWFGCTNAAQTLGELTLGSDPHDPVQADRSDVAVRDDHLDVSDEVLDAGTVPGAVVAAARQHDAAGQPQ